MTRALASPSRVFAVETKTWMNLGKIEFSPITTKLLHCFLFSQSSNPQEKSLQNAGANYKAGWQFMKGKEKQPKTVLKKKKHIQNGTTTTKHMVLGSLKLLHYRR
jgi:hypothetical protein